MCAVDVCVIAPNSRRTTEIRMKNRDMLLARAALVSILLLVAGLSVQSQSPESKSGQWRIAGQNLSNTWSQPVEHSISPANVKELKPKWVFTTGGDVSATPTVDGDAVYFPDWAGNLFAVKKDSGRLIWSHKISEYDGVDGAISRVSPAVDGNQVIIGDILSGNKVHNGANVMAVDSESGMLRWMTHVDDHPAAIITGSPVVFDGVVYIGVSSSEEALALDPKRGTLFIGTGNNYTAPADVEACQNETPTANCAAADDFFDTALALDLKSGQVKWAKRLQGL